MSIKFIRIGVRLFHGQVVPSSITFLFILVPLSLYSKYIIIFHIVNLISHYISHKFNKHLILSHIKTIIPPKITKQEHIVSCLFNKFCFSEQLRVFQLIKQIHVFARPIFGNWLFIKRFILIDITDFFTRVTDYFNDNCLCIN